jgi:hypothetical protein
MGRRRVLGLLWVVVATLVVPMAGCDCAEPGPTLGTTSGGRPAVGWATDGDLRVRSISFEVGGAVRWRLEAIEPASPSVLVLGQGEPGYDEAVAAAEPIGLDAVGVVVVEYDHGAVGRRSDLAMSAIRGATEVRDAEVREYECGGSVGFVVVFLLWALLAVVGVLVALVLMVGTGAVVLLAVARSVVERRR